MVPSSSCFDLRKCTSIRVGVDVVCLLFLSQAIFFLKSYQNQPCKWPHMGAITQNAILGQSLSSMIAVHLHPFSSKWLTKFERSIYTGNSRANVTSFKSPERLDYICESEGKNAADVLQTWTWGTLMDKLFPSTKRRTWITHFPWRNQFAQNQNDLPNGKPSVCMREADMGVLQ